jgi:hypothetical protein
VKGLLAALCAAAVLPVAACPLPGAPLQAGAVQLAWQAPGPAIEVGRHFVLELQLCPADAVLTRVDATMPEHRHGMNYRPSLQPLGGGRWRAEGLMFHMPGRWELRFDVADGGKTETLRQSIHLP